MTPELERLRPSLKLPTLPAVASQLLEMARDPNVGIESLAGTIAYDPALSAKILSTASSPWYFRGTRCSTLSQALRLLGLNSAFTLVLSFSLLRSLRSNKTVGLDYELFWRRSLLAALAARTLGQQARTLKIEELFLAALIQDIGMLALVQADPNLYAAGAELQRNHEKLAACERVCFGYDHAEIGAWLMQEWRLPEHVVEAVKDSHLATPQGLESTLSFNRIVALSGRVADGFLWPEESERLKELAGSLDRHVLEELLDRMLEQMQPTEKLFDIRLLGARADEMVRQARELIADRQRAQLQTGPAARQITK